MEIVLLIAPNTPILQSLFDDLIFAPLRLEWGTLPATNPVALDPDLSIRKVLFCVLRKLPANMLQNLFLNLPPQTVERYSSSKRSLAVAAAFAAVAQDS